MFTPPSFERGCFPGPENSRSGRGSISSRFPIGITSLGDENQQIRIQLAVHKYNNSAAGPVNNRRSLMAPVRHSFTKSLLRSKNYEEDAEPLVRNERKVENQYEGVGAFPTVHLKKNVVLYRPFRKFREVKVPCPELPVNRFLSHLPELCPDMKSDSRSALDVLQDMSRKNIHSREDDDYNKLKSKGLCGDFAPGVGPAYKPLFVPKQKHSAVLTKDNTTQTLLSHGLDATSPHHDSNNTTPTTSVSDQKAELRRKLARQNNEIFASLSSSILSSIPVKRKIDKVLPPTDNEHLNGESALKKPKMSEKNNTTSGKMSASSSNSNLSDYSAKISRRRKVNEITSTSPNKDRFTTIYLDMEDTSSKNQMFSNSTTIEAEKSVQNNASDSSAFSNTLSTNNNLTKDNGALVVNGTNANFNDASNGLKNSSVLNFISPDEKRTTLSSNSAEDKSESNMKPSSFLTGQEVTSAANDSGTKSDASQKSSNGINASFLNYPLTPANNVNGKSNSSGNNGTEKILNNNITNANGDGISNQSNQTPSLPFTFGSPKNNETSLSGTFKFGVGGNFTFNPSTSKPSIIEETSKANTPSFITSTSSTSTIANISDAFKTKPVEPAPVTQNFNSKSPDVSSPSSDLANFQQRNNSAQSGGHNTFLPSMKPLCGSNEQNGSEKANILGGNSQTSIPTTQNSSGATSTLFNQNIQTASATTTQLESKISEPSSENRESILDKGQNPSNNFLSQPSSLNSSNGQTSIFSPVGNTFQVVVSQSASSQSTTFPQNPTFQTSQASISKGQSGETNPLFTFGQKAATPAVSQPTNLFGAMGEPKKQPDFSFPYEQKPQDSDQNKAPGVTGFEQKNSTNLFSFGIKPSTSESTENKPGASNISGQSTIAQSSLPKPLTQTKADQPLLFGQKVSQTSNDPINSQGAALPQSQNLLTETSSLFGSKAENPTFGLSTQPTTFDQKNSIFPAKTSIFGSTANQSSPANQSGGFGSSSTQPTNSFGTSTTSQQFGIGFRPPVSTQSTAFGVPSSTMSTNGFGSTATTQSFGFGLAPSSSSAQPSSTFGVPSVTQSATGFGLSSVSQTSLAQPFGQNNNNKPSNSLAPTSNIFGQAVNQNPVSSTGFTSPSGSNFNSSTGQNNIFGQNTKIETPSFGQNLTSPSFGAPNKFSFGMSTSNPTGFTASPPTTTSAPVFNFGGGSSANPGSAFSFGGSTSLNTSNTQTPFTFKGSSSDTFKFGASTTKEEPGFGVANTATFSFGGQANNAIPETKPAGTGFSFGSNQPSASASTFNFGSTPSPAVFSFGSSTSSASSGSTFNFGTPQPGGPFGQSSTPSPAPFPVPGNFSIGSGSSQSRPRASSRLRRRP